MSDDINKKIADRISDLQIESRVMEADYVTSGEYNHIKHSHDNPFSYGKVVQIHNELEFLTNLIGL